MTGIPLIIFSLTPVFLIMLFIYNKDKNKEPKNVIIKLLISGVGSTFITVFITLILGTVFDIFLTDYTKLSGLKLIIHTFVAVALIEETSKFIMLNKLSKIKECDEDYDMLLYGGLIGLGFAAFENILYVAEYDLKVAILRAFTAVPLHATLGIIMGYILLKYKNNKEKKHQYNSIIVPTIIHGLYDYLIMTELTINVVIAIIVIIVTLMFGIIIINKVSRNNNRINATIYNNGIYKELYCPKCGIPYELAFCRKCGRKRE